MHTAETLFLFRVIPGVPVLSPTALDGKPICTVDKELVRPWHVTRAKAELYRKKRKLKDRVGFNSSNLMISHRLHDLLTAVKLDPAIGFIPLELFEEGNPAIRAEYMLGFSQVEHDVLDRELSEYTLFKGKQVIDQISRYVLKTSALPAADIFFAHHRWIVREIVERRCREAKMTGCKFEPVEVSHSD
jgi:hypothetical protein